MRVIPFFIMASTIPMTTCRSERRLCHFYPSWRSLRLCERLFFARSNPLFIINGLQRRPFSKMNPGHAISNSQQGMSNVQGEEVTGWQGEGFVLSAFESNKNTWRHRVISCMIRFFLHTSWLPFI